jgi:hypothetical protein
MEFEIYIDNEKMKTLKKTFKTIGLAIKEANMLLRKKGKLIISIDVNGSEFDENYLYTDKKQILEIKTKTQSTILLDGILLSREYLTKYFDILTEINFEEEQFLDIKEGVKELLDLTGWFYGLLIATVENYQLQNSELGEYLYRYEEEIVGLKEAYDEGNINYVLDILENEMGILLGEFLENYDRFKDELFKEDGISRFLS